MKKQSLPVTPRPFSQLTTEQQIDVVKRAGSMYEAYGNVYVVQADGKTGMSIPKDTPFLKEVRWRR